MNIEELKEFLHQIGVPKSSYNIDSDETLISPETKQLFDGLLAYINQ